MRSIGHYILKGRLQAIIVTGLLTLISLMLPPLSYLFSGVPVGLVTLRHGIYAGLQIIAGSYLLIFVFLLAVSLQPQIATSFLLGIWLPVLICAITLRLTESQGKMIIAAGLIGLVYIIATHILLDNVAMWWQDWLDSWLIQALPSDQKDQYSQLLSPVAPMLNAMMACGLTLSIILTTLIARWWQALLFNRGGFGREFYNLQLPGIMMIPVIVGIGLVILGKAEPGNVLLDIFVLLIFLYLFQGVAMVHRLTVEKKLPRFWIYLMYLLLFVLPQTILFLACIGMVDSWWGRRTKIADHNDQS